MRRGALVLACLVTALFTTRAIQAQHHPEEQLHKSSAAAPGRMVVFEAFMRPT